MVPNHMGIDSPWVIEHPDWFVQLDYSPFPSYSFNGPDLSSDPAVGIYLEDHYLRPHRCGGGFQAITTTATGRPATSITATTARLMPWNDTAQLNYLNPEVREAVIQTILAVARRFPIIRFDAAMTLAKKHYQRLWYPRAGHRRGHPLPRRARADQRAVQRRLPGRILARGGRPGGQRGARYPAAGRSLLDDGRLLRAHARHAPRLQQRLYEHAAQRGKRQIPHR